jgi:hypothetical protein
MLLQVDANAGNEAAIPNLTSQQEFAIWQPA